MIIRARVQVRADEGPGERVSTAWAVTEREPRRTEASVPGPLSLSAPLSPNLSTVISQTPTIRACETAVELAERASGHLKHDSASWEADRCNSQEARGRRDEANWRVAQVLYCAVQRELLSADK